MAFADLIPDYSRRIVWMGLESPEAIKLSIPRLAVAGLNH